MAISTLYDYYTSKGQALPSVQQRAPIYAQQGGQGTYTGTAEQNTFLLGKLQAPPAQTGVPSPTVPTTIGASNLQGTTQPMQIPPYQAPQQNVPDINTLLAQFNAPSADQSAAQGEQGDILAQTKAILDKQGSQGARQSELEGQLGVPELNKNLVEIQNQIRALNAEAFQQTQNQEGRLVPQMAIVGEQERIQRLNAARQYGLAATAQAMQGSLALAQDSVERALRSEFSGLESQLKYQQTLLELNRDKLSKADQKKTQALEIALGERGRLLEQQKADKKQLYDIVVAAAQNGAPPALLNQAMQGNLDTALGTLQQYLQKGETQVVKLDNGQTVLLDTKTGSIIKNIGGAAIASGTPAQITGANGEPLQYGTPEYMVARLQQTAGSKKLLTQSEREQIGKFSNVIALTGNLMGSLNKTTNDPIIGYMKSLNPYDFDARAVNAQVTALVPSVARALYGEVGVLTDQDIARYLGTLPNIKSTADQNKFIAMMTLANAKRSFESTLMNAASSGINVSGFVDSYKDLNQKLNQLEAELATGFGGGTYKPEEKKEFDFAAPSEPQGLYYKAKDWFSGFLGS